MRPGFLQGDAHAPRLTHPTIAAIQAVFARCYGGQPTDWHYVEDAAGPSIRRAGAPATVSCYDGYHVGPWASDTLRALLCLDAVCALPVDNDVLAAYACAGQPLDGRRTAYAGLHRLSRLRSVRRDAHGAWQPYQTPAPREPALSRAFLSLDAAAEALRCALRTAIRAQIAAHESRLPAGHPVQALLELSGGLDSTLIAAIARHEVPSLHCVTVDASAILAHRDADWAANAAQRLGLAHHRVPLVALGTSESAAVRSRSPEPAALPAWDTQRALLEWKQQQGATLVWTGHGADDLFALTPGELDRQRAQWGVGHGLVQMTRAAWARKGLPSTQLLRRAPIAKRQADAWEHVVPWYSHTAEPALRAMLDRRVAMQTDTAWTRYWQAPYFLWAASGIHPGATGVPVWTEHPFLDETVVALTRQIPPWPHFDTKAVVRRALVQEGLTAHALRPKETVAGDIQLRAWMHTAEGHAALTETMALRAAQLDATPHDWADTTALRHVFTHWARYPRSALSRLPLTLAVLDWSATAP